MKLPKFEKIILLIFATPLSVFDFMMVWVSLAIGVSTTNETAALLLPFVSLYFLNEWAKQLDQAVTGRREK